MAIRERGTFRYDQGDSVRGSLAMSRRYLMDGTIGGKDRPGMNNLVRV
jgi:hypothetical protein